VLQRLRHRVVDVERAELRDHHFPHRHVVERRAHGDHGGFLLGADVDEQRDEDQERVAQEPH
jgi:hypothetical protein